MEALATAGRDGRKALSNKTRKLVEAAAMISETLKTLESDLLSKAVRMASPSRDAGMGTAANAGQPTRSDGSTGSSDKLQVQASQSQSQQSLASASHASVQPQQQTATHNSRLRAQQHNGPTQRQTARQTRRAVELHTSSRTAANRRSTKSAKAPAHQRANVHHGENVRSIFGANANIFSPQQPQADTQQPSSAKDAVIVSDQAVQPVPVLPVAVAVPPELEHENAMLRVHQQQQQQPGCSLGLTADPTTPSAAQDHQQIQSLQTRVAQLESDLAKAKAQAQDATYQSTTLAAKGDSLHTQNHELQMKLSRQALEMKAMCEQNDMLRGESRRLQDEGSQLKAQLAEMSDALDCANSAKITAVDPTLSAWLPSQETARDSLLSIINDRIRGISSKQAGYQSSQSNGNRTAVSSIMRQLDTLSKSMHAIVRLVQSSTPSPNTHQFLTTCAEMVDLLLAICDDVCLSFEDSLQIDQRIERLRDESTQIRVEAERMVQSMTERFHTDTAALEQERTVLRDQVAALTRDLTMARQSQSDLATTVDSLTTLNKELKRVNAELENQLESSTVSSDDRGKQAAAAAAKLLPVDVGDFALPTVADLAHTDKIKSLQDANHGLQSHVDYLEKTIEKWKGENESLREALRRHDERLQAKEAESHRLAKKVSVLETAVGDEQLRTSKAMELVKTLKDDVHKMRRSAPESRWQAAHDAGGERDVDRGGQTSDLERAFEERVAAIHQKQQRSGSPGRGGHGPSSKAAAAAMAAAATVGLGSQGGNDFSSLFGRLLSSAGSTGDAFEIEALLRLIKDNESTSQQLAKFGETIEEMINRIKSLEDDNQQLRQRASAIKDKMRSRESAWVDKLKSLRRDYTKSVDDCQQLDQVLADYERQFSNILVFTDGIAKIEAPPAGHPYPFASVFAMLSNEYVAATHQSALLQQRVGELQQTIEDKEALLQGQVLTVETMSVASQELKNEIHNLQKQAEMYERRLGDAQRELKQSEDKCMMLETKLKRLLQGYKTFLAVPISSPDRS
ncbi:hypothetical protein BC831DRAFT_469806 [Entophlyctis helioformis]|nr:hypothetical protein BC831DRAFT_469806 [Entophlyctis helioformis]